jgi:hypothetical protein
MNNAELKIAIELGLDKSASFQIAAFESEDIEYWVNDAQTQLIKQKMFGNNTRGEGFDQGSKRVDDLNTLVVSSAVLEFDEAHTTPEFRPHTFYPNIAVVDIDATNTPNYMFYVGADLKATAPSGAQVASKPVPTILIKQSEASKLIETPYNKPYLKEGYVYIEDGELNVVYDPYITLQSILITYLKKPSYIDLTNPTGVNDLPEQLHPELVALTVNLMLDNIADPREQANYIQLTRKE